MPRVPEGLSAPAGLRLCDADLRCPRNRPQANGFGIEVLGVCQDETANLAIKDEHVRVDHLPIPGSVRQNAAQRVGRPEHSQRLSKRVVIHKPILGAPRSAPAGSLIDWDYRTISTRVRCLA